MPRTIVEDRLLARVAQDAVGWNASADAAEIADRALGQAVVALRVMGVEATPLVLRTLRGDIALVLAEPERVARAARLAPGEGTFRPANTNLAPRFGAAVG